MDDRAARLEQVIRKAEERGEWNGFKAGLELGCLLGMMLMAGLIFFLLYRG